MIMDMFMKMIEAIEYLCKSILCNIHGALSSLPTRLSLFEYIFVLQSPLGFGWIQQIFPYNLFLQFS